MYSGEGYVLEWKQTHFIVNVVCQDKVNCSGKMFPVLKSLEIRILIKSINYLLKAIRVWDDVSLNDIKNEIFGLLFPTYLYNIADNISA